MTLGTPNVGGFGATAKSDVIKFCYVYSRHLVFLTPVFNFLVVLLKILMKNKRICGLEITFP